MLIGLIKKIFNRCHYCWNSLGKNPYKFIIKSTEGKEEYKVCTSCEVLLSTIQNRLDVKQSV